MGLFKKVILVVILSCLNISLAWAKTNVKEAVVKIYTTYNKYDYYEPWQMLGQEERTGSGCIINGNRILTNAHVVGDQTFIQVRKAGDAKKYMAEVEIVAHECDLALLKVKDESFFSGVTPLRIGELSEVKDTVAVYGFPKGGDELSITEGIVSRVEHRNYTHSSANLLTCQIDASINDGSSGGPVVKDGKIVGVAFQSFGGENIGFMVPPPIIEHFMEDIQDGKYDGLPDIGIRTQPMENPDLRRKYHMSDKQTGNLINEIYPDSPSKGILYIDDIILEIEGHSIANDGTVEFRKGERTSGIYFIQSKQINDKLKLKILRNGTIKTVEITLSQPTNYYSLVPPEQYDVPPTYYILGGLVFESLTLNFLKGFGEQWYYDAPLNLMHYAIFGEPKEDRREIILLTRVLADEINVGYPNKDWQFSVISRVNGTKISTMRDLVRAFEENKEEYYIIESEYEFKIIMDKQKVDEYSKRIIDRYQISSDRSEDLRD